MSKTNSKRICNKRGLPAIIGGLIICLLALFYFLNRTDYNATINETQIKQYTVIDIEEIGRNRLKHSRSRGYNVFVSEEEKPIFLNSVCYTNTDMEAFKRLSNGDRIICRISLDCSDQYSGELVEISVDGKYILTFEGYSDAYNENQMVAVFLILSFGLFFLMLGLLVFFDVFSRNRFLRKLNRKLKSVKW